MTFTDAIAFIETNRGKVTIDDTGDEPVVTVVCTTRLYTIRTAGPTIEDAAEKNSRIVTELNEKALRLKQELAAAKNPTQN
jgi:hypothetical protein